MYHQSWYVNAWHDPLIEGQWTELKEFMRISFPWLREANQIPENIRTKSCKEENNKPLYFFVSNILLTIMRAETFSQRRRIMTWKSVGATKTSHPIAAFNSWRSNGFAFWPFFAQRGNKARSLKRKTLTLRVSIEGEEWIESSHEVKEWEIGGEIWEPWAKRAELKVQFSGAKESRHFSIFAPCPLSRFRRPFYLHLRTTSRSCFVAGLLLPLSPFSLLHFWEYWMHSWKHCLPSWQVDLRQSLLDDVRF